MYSLGGIVYVYNILFGENNVVLFNKIYYNVAYVYNVVNPIINHPQNHHKWVAQTIFKW
jgi:hypothetical protein